jgi:hypothetical protein
MELALPESEQEKGPIMTISNQTVKSLYIALVFLLGALQSTVACATTHRNPAASNPAGPSLILDNKIIFDDTNSRPIEGPRTGGGGNSCALAITQNTKSLVTLLDRESFYGIIDTEKLFPVIKKARFYIQDGLVKNNQKKDAMNFPKEGKILITPNFCATELVELSGRSMSLLLHEYLGLAGIDDQKYQLSGKFLEIYAAASVKGAEVQAYLSNELKKEFSGKKSCFGGLVQKQVDEDSRYSSDVADVQVQQLGASEPVITFRNCPTLLDKNRKETENEKKAAYRKCYATDASVWLGVIAFHWRRKAVDETANLYFKVSRTEEFETTIKGPPSPQYPDGFPEEVSSTSKLSFTCKPMQIDDSLE